MKKFVQLLITVYQRTFSPDHGPAKHVVAAHLGCRFYPSCSQYTKEAVLAHGALKGVAKGIKRIIRCNPFCEGGYDPVLK